MNGELLHSEQHPLRAWSVLVAVLLATSVPSTAAEPDAAQPKGHSKGILIRFEGPIVRMNQQYLYRKLEVAKQAGADLIVVEIDSPGGLLTESLDIASTLRDFDGAQVVAFVPKEALSGAAIMALGCGRIVMAPNARLGDAGPIFQDEDFLFRHVPEKIRSDLALQVRDLALHWERSPALAEAMVDMDLVVYPMTHRETGDVAYMSDAEIESDEESDEWEKGKPVHESKKGQFLEVNAHRAVELGLAEAVVADRDALARHFGLAGEFRVIEPGLTEAVVELLNRPVVTVALFIIGLVALYVEFSAPGVGVGGLTAGLCFALFFWGRFFGGTAEWLHVVLFVTGVIFILVEMFVIPGFGFAGVTGILLLVAGLLMAMQGFVIPETENQLQVFSGTLLVGLVSSVGFLIIAFFLSRHFGSLPLLNRLALEPPGANTVPSVGSREATGRPDEAVPGTAPKSEGPQPGDRGIAVSSLVPAGKVRFDHRLTDVVSDGTFIEEGAEVEVIHRAGNRIMVGVVRDEP